MVVPVEEEEEEVVVVVEEDDFDRLWEGLWCRVVLWWEGRRRGGL